MGTLCGLTAQSEACESAMSSTCHQTEKVLDSLTVTAVRPRRAFSKTPSALFSILFLEERTPEEPNP